MLGQDCEDLRPARLAVEGLAQGLRGSGHQVDVLSLGPDRRETGRRTAVMVPIATVADRALAKRGFATPLAQIPLTAAVMLLGGYEVAHAFSAPGAGAALIWRRFTSGAVVFTPIAPVDRARLSDRRLRLRLMRQACENCDAVTVTDAEARAALQRWMALRAPVIKLGDVSGNERLYQSLTSPQHG